MPAVCYQFTQTGGVQGVVYVASPTQATTINVGAFSGAAAPRSFQTSANLAPAPLAPSPVSSFVLVEVAAGGDVDISHVAGVLILTSTSPTFQEQFAPSAGILNLTAGTDTRPALGFDEQAGILNLTAGEHTITITGNIDIAHVVGILNLTAGVHTFSAGIIHVAGVLNLLGGDHILGGDIEVPTTVLLSGVRRKGFNWVPPHFVQILFDKIRPSTRSIEDVRK